MNDSSRSAARPGSPTRAWASPAKRRATNVKRTSSIPSPNHCPSREQLRAFSQASLHRELMDSIEQHLCQCERCMSELDAWEEESDALIRALAALPSGPDDEPAFQALQTALLSSGERVDLGDSPTASFVETIHAETNEVPDQIGGYRLLALIGQGATGAVFRARHLKLDRIVAIKVLNRQYVGHDSQAVRRFRQEMRAVGQLDHAHIVRATDAGEADGRHFLVMEYVDGIDASRLLRLTGPLRVADACEIARQAATALDVAHQHNMVHRDVKPSNLLFSYDGQVKLLDLGLVRNDTSATDAGDAWQTNVPHGTADYMPPEQWTQFAAVDTRADIYALGCTLYKLLTGKPVYPRPRQDYGAKMDAHLSAPVPSVRHERPDVPLGLQKIIFRMLAKRPSDRYDSAAEVAERLLPYTQGARLTELGVRIASSSGEEIGLLLSEPATSSHPIPTRRHRPTRRSMLLATTAAVPLATLLWRFRPRRTPTLQVVKWRNLQPTEPPRSFPVSGRPGDTATSATLETTPDSTLKVATFHDSLIHLGQPVQGRFSLQAEFTVKTPLDRLGLFFKYRPHKVESTVAHPFQVIELAPAETVGYRLFWSHYCFYEEPGGTYRRDYTQWAETAVGFAPESEPGQLTVAFGRAGFPDVRWKDVLLTESHWTVSWQARNMSQQTRDELKHAYLGRLGIFVRSSSAVFSRLQLRYLDEREIL